MPSAASTRPAQLPALTGYRFVAAGAIVALHAWESFGLAFDSLRFLSYAVSFFFVLSGFILSHAHPGLSGATERHRFWWARLARIWPLHLLTLGLTIALLPWGQLAGQSMAWATLPLNAALLQAWVPVPPVALSYNGVAWSISVEACFYFLFPLLIGRRTSWLVGLLAMVVAVRLAIPSLTVALGLPDFPPRSFGMATVLGFNPLARLYEFLLGMLAFRWWRAGVASRASTPVIIAAEIIGWLMLAWLTYRWPELVGASERWFGALMSLSLLPIPAALLFAGLIILGADGRGVVSRLLALPWAVFLGEISFSVYLTHQLLHRVLGEWGWFTWLPGKGGGFGYLLLVLLFSAATWRFVEVPARRALLRWYDQRIAPPRTTVAATQ